MKKKIVQIQKTKEMSKLISIKSIFLAIAIIGSVTLSAQNDGNIQGQMQQTKAKDVSQKELKQFADAYQDVQMENQKINQEMMKVIEDGGLEVDRFKELQQANSNPDEKTDATKEELKKQEKIVAKIQEMTPQLQKRMEGVIGKSGLDMEKYKAIAAAVQQDQDLQQKLQKLMMSQQMKQNSDQ